MDMPEAAIEARDTMEALVEEAVVTGRGPAVAGRMAAALSARLTYFCSTRSSLGFAPAAAVCVCKRSQDS